MSQELEDKLRDLPSTPGVYLMNDTKGDVLYVGKARDLRKRVSCYFATAAHKDLKATILIEKIAGFDTIITNTEKEALILESNLIKTYRPRYNVILKDDKRYPCLRLNVKSPYPNLTIARKLQRDGALYFGPFASAGAVRETLKLIHRTFRLRKCKATNPKRRERPCLNHQMGLCLGPCNGTVDRVEYAGVVNEVILFLRGRMPELIKEVKDQMESAAARQDFETAAVHRDRLFALQETLEKQVATTPDFKDRDVVGMARKGEAAMVMVLFIRGGYLVGNRAFHLSEAMASDSEMIASFVKQYYESAPFVPKEVLLPKPLEDKALLEEWLGELKGERVYIITPKRGEKARILQMAVQNAKKSLQEHMNSVLDEEGMLRKVQERLALHRSPQRIECIDLSNMAGTEGVGGMVVFERGRPTPRAYRKYRIKTAPGADDYAMLREVLKRRYKERGTQESLPDLLVVDGGKGQLNVAVATLKTLNLDGLFDLVGVAKKDRQKGETEDKVYKPGRKNPLNLKKDAQVLLFLQRIRDEAHRYVIAYHRKRRLMTYRRSVLEGIPGIGSKRRAQLLKRFGSLKRIRSASLEELCSVAGMTRQAAQTLFKALRQAETNHQS